MNVIRASALTQKHAGMRLIGITGGIGSGKSVVSRILRLRGEAVYDCDLEARRLMETPQMRELLEEALGERVYTAEGTLDRQRMSTLIFGDSGKRDTVNRIVHQRVLEDLLEWRGREERKKGRGGTLYVESAILAGSGLASHVDEVWEVTAGKETRVNRVMSRSHLTAEEVCRRIESQRSERELLVAICRRRDIPLREIRNDGELLTDEIRC